MNTQASDSPGWFGKIASLGDFASRRLPADFIALWDAWLQQVISMSRRQLGDAWLNAYLTCPVWRFILQPGVCGEGVWAGVLMPSVDKVGRYFPLTVIAALPVLPSGERELRSLCGWLEEMEHLSLSTLNARYSMQRFDDEIAAAPPPLVSPLPSRTLLATQLLAALREEKGVMLELPSADALPETLADVGGLLIGEASRGSSLWWAQGAPEGGAPLRVCRGLPDARCFAAMLSPVFPEGL